MDKIVFSTIIKLVQQETERGKLLACATKRVFGPLYIVELDYMHMPRSYIFHFIVPLGNLVTLTIVGVSLSTGREFRSDVAFELLPRRI